MDACACRPAGAPPQHTAARRERERNHMRYNPKPIDTSGVTLTEDILALTELLAQHAHEIWAYQRLAEGWTHGPQRDDGKKEHPGLVPYGVGRLAPSSCTVRRWSRTWCYTRMSAASIHFRPTCLSYTICGRRERARGVHTQCPARVMPYRYLDRSFC